MPNAYSLIPDPCSLHYYFPGKGITMGSTLKRFSAAAIATLSAAILAIAAALSAPVTPAQTLVEAQRVAAEVARVAGKLPPESQAVITRLTLLGHLQDGAWKTHSGDVAHGESATLDDS